jgi:hypothetical protein
VVDGEAVFEAKQNTRPIIVIDNYDSFTYNLCQVEQHFVALLQEELLHTLWQLLI